MRQLTFGDELDRQAMEAEIRKIYEQNVPFIAMMLRSRHRRALLRAARSGLLLHPNPIAAAESAELYLVVRRSIRQWLKRDKPGSPRTYIGWALWSWSTRVLKQRVRINARHVPGGDMDPVAASVDLDLDHMVSQLPEDLAILARSMIRRAKESEQARELGIPRDEVHGMHERLRTTLEQLLSNEAIACGN